MKIANKLLLLILVASVSVFILAATGLLGMKTIEEGLENLNDNSIPSVVLLDEAGRDFLRLRVRVLNHLMNEDPELAKKFEADIDKHSTSVVAGLERYGREMVTDEKDRELLAADQAAIKAYFELRDKGLALSRENRKSEAQRLFIENAAVSSHATDVLVEHAQFNVDAARQEGESAKAVYRKMNWLLFSVAALAAACTIVVGYTIRKNVIESLAGLRDTLGKIETNLDFTHRAKVERNDEVGETVHSFNRLTEKLQGSLRHCRANRAGECCSGQPA